METSHEAVTQRTTLVVVWTIMCAACYTCYQTQLLGNDKAKCLGVSIAVVKHPGQKQLVRIAKDFFQLTTTRSQSITEGNQGRNSGQELRQKP